MALKKVERHTLSHKEKRDVCCEKQKNPSMSNRELVVWVEEKFGTKVHEATIGRLLKKRYALLLNVTANEMKRARAPQCPALEEALYRWFLAAQEGKLAISDNILVEKAKLLHAHLLSKNPELKDCKFSSGWTHNFKKRHNITFRVLHGKEGSVEVTDDTWDQIVALKATLSAYENCDVYNMDETGLFYRLKPNKTLRDKAVKGQKVDKTRITVGLCCNSDGSVKLPPVIINKSKMPRAFSSRKIKRPNNLGIVWYANKTAWMKAVVFQDWLCRFERRMQALGRKKVALLVDNCPGHIIGSAKQSLKVTTVFFLPANTTARFQPMDVGIIQSFKVYYRKLFVKAQLAAFEKKLPFDIDVYDAVQMTLQAWGDGVKVSTIVNCWEHTGLSISRDTRPNRAKKDFDLEVPLEDADLASQVDNLGEYLSQLSEKYPMDMTVEDYLFADCVQNAPTFCMEEDVTQYLVTEVGAEDEVEDLGEALDDANEDEEPELEVDEVPTMPYEVGMGLFDSLRTFLQQQDYDTEALLSDLGRIRKLLTRDYTASLVQSKPDDFLHQGSRDSQEGEHMHPSAGLDSQRGNEEEGRDLADIGDGGLGESHVRDSQVTDFPGEMEFQAEGMAWHERAIVLSPRPSRPSTT